MSAPEALFDHCDDPAMHDADLRAMLELAHCENLWISCEPESARWLIDGDAGCVTVPYGSGYSSWRQALLQAAGVTRCSAPVRASAR